MVLDRPLRPDEVGAAKATALPAEVFQVFNELIAAASVNGRATVKQKDVVAALCAKLDLERHQVFERHLLDVEDAYRAAGWSVIYDKPAWDENYDPYFRFERAS